MNIPCDIHVNCPPVLANLEYDSPLANFSSEAPDQDLFIGVNTGWNLNLPPLGSFWTSQGCLSICESAISQQDADLCAARQEIACTINGGLTGSLGRLTQPWLLPNGNPVPLFPNLNQSCSFTCPDGLLFTWTVSAGQVLDPNPVAANEIAFSLACRQANLHYLCLPSLPNTCLNASYLQTIVPTAGPAVAQPLSFVVSAGSLPPGLNLIQITNNAAQIIGTPSAAGNFPFTIRVTDANGNFMQKQYVVGVVGISNISSIPSAMENTAYNVQLNGAGGTAPYTFVLVSGNLPGITLSSSGLLSGTPNYVTAGKYPFTVTITDANGVTCTQNGTLKVTLRPGPDWTQFTWTTYQINQTPGHNTASGQGIQNVAFGQMQGDGVFPNPSISPAAASGVTYTGPSVTARIILTVSNSAAVNGMCSRLLRNGLAIGGPGCHQFNSGTYQTDIVIPLGVNDVYTIDDASPGNAFAQINTAGTLSFTWAIVNV